MERFNLKKYDDHSLRICFLIKVDIEYPMELRKLSNGYFLAWGKLEIWNIALHYLSYS